MSVVDTEQIESDIASARETLDNVSAGIDKMHQELRSLTNKVAKSEVRTHRHPSANLTPELTTHTATTEPDLIDRNDDDRRSTARRSAGCRKSVRR